MNNSEIAGILYEIGEYLEMRDIPFKPRAYRKAAGIIEDLQKEIGEIYEGGGFKAVEKIPGVGVSIAGKIEELLKTGRLKYYEELKKKTPVNLSELTAVEGLGPKKIKELYQKIGIRDLRELEAAARAGKIKKLEGFGIKSEENILKGIKFLKKSEGRFILSFIMPVVQEIENRLRDLKEVKKVITAGSVRRRQETVGDIDILIISEQPKLAMDYFVNMPEVINIYAHGKTKSAVKLNNGIKVDLRAVPEESYGAALNYFTGSKDHNVALRGIALKKGWKLNEYGLYKNGKQFAGTTEEEIYNFLGLDYIEPEMRENSGEIDLAKNHCLPRLINYGDLRGDLQVQTNWTDGAHSIEEMAKAAFKAGLKYIAITDHTKKLAITGGLDEKKIVEQWREIDALNLKFKNQNLKFRILKGVECDILKDGSLDLPDNILSKLDVVGVSVHSHFNLSRRDQTERIKKAMRNPHTDIVFHPTGRILKKRDGYDVDMEDLIKTAKTTGAVLEIDAYPSRLDLKDEYIRKSVLAGVKMSIDSDAHSAAHFSYLEYGIAQARRGWAKKNDIINGWPLEKMLKMLKKQ